MGQSANAVPLTFGYVVCGMHKTNLKVQKHSFLHFSSPKESKGFHFYEGKSSRRALLTHFSKSVEYMYGNPVSKAQAFLLFSSYSLFSPSLCLCLSDSLPTLLPLFLSDFGPRVLDSLLLFVVVVRLSTRTGPAQQ